VTGARLIVIAVFAIDCHRGCVYHSRTVPTWWPLPRAMATTLVTAGTITLGHCCGHPRVLEHLEVACVCCTSKGCGVALNCGHCGG
jgi:hypothetical protein